MNRRLAIKHGSMALVGLGLGACRTTSRLDVGMRSARPARHLAPVLASWDRVLRTTVGLRPHRKSGFVLRAEKRGAVGGLWQFDVIARVGERVVAEGVVVLSEA